MKKVLLFSIACLLGIAVMAQNSVSHISGKLAKQSKTAMDVRMNDNDPMVGSAPANPLVSAKAIIGDSLGESWYDLQTNKCIQNRILKHADGTISAAWTYSMQSSAWSDRGSGYNYYDGTAWLPFPTVRIESVRVGWPSVTVANGNEVVITHNGGGLSMTTRTKGTGAWTTNPIAHTAAKNQTWPRAMGVGLGSQVIHVIATDYTGTVANGMVYSRTSDAGATWDIQDSILPGTDPATEILPTGGDSYSMDVKGDTIAIVTGDMTSDIVLVKSLDGGDTWTSQKVWQHQIPLWNTGLSGDPAGTSDVNGDGDPDTITCSDGRLALVIGNDGVIHVFTGITRVLRDLTMAADNFSWWPYVDGVVYWNSTLPIITPDYYFDADTLLNKVGYMIDVNGDDSINFNADGGNGAFGEYAFTGLSSMPSASVGADGAIYCTYSSVVEGTDFGDGRGFRNIYAVKTPDNGATWTPPLNITQDDFSECTFGSLNKKVDTDVHMIFQRSIEPGNSLQPSTGNIHVPQNTGQIYVKHIKDFPMGVNQMQSSSFAIDQNYPNPANSSTDVRVNLKKASSLSLVVSNMLGQNVMTLNKGNVGTGTHTFTIDCSNLNSGVYFYTVKAGENSMTKKMIVE